LLGRQSVVQGTDDRLRLLLSYMRMGVRMSVGRGVIVIMIGMIMARVVRMIVGSVRLRWRMSINMIVILPVSKSSRSVYELENTRQNGQSGNWGTIKRAVVVEGVSLICQGYNLPVCLPVCHTQTGPPARRFDHLIFPSTCDAQPQHTASTPSPRGSTLPPRRRPNTRRHVPGVVGGLGRDDAACVCLPAREGTEPHRGGLRM
jgi:hypothetical protein